MWPIEKSPCHFRVVRRPRAVITHGTAQELGAAPRIQAQGSPIARTAGQTTPLLQRMDSDGICILLVGEFDDAPLADSAVSLGAMNRCLSMLLALSIGPMVFAQDATAKPDTAEPVAAELQAKTGVVYKTVGDVELRLYLFFPKDHLATDTRPAAVFYFGGGWNSGSTEQFKPHARYLASRGMVTAVCDYRVKKRHGTNPFACVADGKSAVRWLRSNAKRLGINPKCIAAGGGSAGGHIAATTGVVPGLEEKGEDTTVSSKANALLLFNPVFDNGPDGYGHNRVKERYREISPLHNIAKGAPPTIVFLGTKDSLIPVATAENYAAKMKAADCRCDLHLYEGQSHGFFNLRNKKHYYLTVLEMDRFLISLGWLQGEPTIKQPKPSK